MRSEVELRQLHVGLRKQAFAAVASALIEKLREESSKKEASLALKVHGSME